jgi:hypothetical protein
MKPPCAGLLAREVGLARVPMRAYRLGESARAWSLHRRGPLWDGVAPMVRLRVRATISPPSIVRESAPRGVNRAPVRFALAFLSGRRKGRVSWVKGGGGGVG